MDSLELFKYFAVAGVGFFIGRITMALQYAVTKKKSHGLKDSQDLNKNKD